MATTDYAEGYAKAEEILAGGSALTVREIGEQLDKRKLRRRVTRWSAGYAAAHLDYLHGIAIAEDAAQADVVTLRIDANGRLLTEPATMVQLECRCCEIRRGVLAVGDHDLCVEHGPTVVAAAIETAIVG